LTDSLQVNLDICPNSSLIHFVQKLCVDTVVTYCLRKKEKGEKQTLAFLSLCSLHQWTLLGNSKSTQNLLCANW